MKAPLSIGANRPERLQVGRDDAGDLGADAVAGQEIGDGDRQRLDIALVDVDLDQRARRQRRHGAHAGGERAGQQDRSEQNSSCTEPLGY